MTTQIPTQFTGYGAKDEASGKRLDLDVLTCSSHLSASFVGVL